MAFDGSYAMTTLPQAIGKAAILKARYTALENDLQDRIDDALALGRPDIADKLTAALEHVHRGHARAGEAAVMVADHYGADPVDVGGETKPDDPPPGGN